MNDPLRIDLAQARAAGLPTRSANASTALLPAASALPASPDALFSPLALLLARFLPSQGAPAPVPTPEEARLLRAYLQQRVVAVLHSAGLPAPATLRVAVDAAGALHLAPAPAQDEVVARLLHGDGDIARLVEMLRRAVPAIPGSDARLLETAAPQASSPRVPTVDGPDPRRAWWPWRVTVESAGERMGPRRAIPPALVLGALVAALLGWWLLS